MLITLKNYMKKLFKACIGGLLLCAGTVSAQAESMTLNLKDADINAVIATVSEMTGKNFIVDPRVKGKVTVVSSKPMEPDELYQVFLTILNVHGFAAIPGKSVIKIVPEINAKQDAIDTVSGTRPGKGDDYVTRVITVENAAAAQLVPILRPLLPQQGHLAAYPATNVLIASGTAANINRIALLIRRIDQASSAEVAIVPLKYANSDEVVRILNSLEQEAAKKGQDPTSMAKIVADPRTNSILISAEKPDQARLRKLIEHLDAPVDASTGSTRVIYLRYANAVDIVGVLTGVGDGIIKDQKSNAPAAAKAAARTKAGGGASDPVLNIQADESTNALVITAPPEIMRDLEQVVRKLDIRRAQVLVKAVIAEVSAERASEFGVQWGYNGSPENDPVGVINFAGSGSGLANLLTNPPTLGDGMSLGLGLTAEDPDTGKDYWQIGALIRALDGDADSNILSTPSLVTLDNEEAEIVVGQNVPFLTGSYSNSGGGTASTPTNPFQTIERQDVGLTLKIKPQINEGNAIKMNVTQEVSSISPATTGASDIVTNKRSINTVVMVDSGDVVVLGGLIDENLRESVQKVPLLGDIPLLGWLFSYQSTSKVKRNLMAFLHPVILRDGKQNQAIATEKYNFIRAQQLDIRERGVSLMRDDVSPLLPEMPDFLELPPPYVEPGASVAPDQAPAEEVVIDEQPG